MSEKTFRRPISWQCGSRTDVGVVREVNEDALTCCSDIGLWAVADGMGGHEVGDVASRMIVNALQRIVDSAHLSDFVDEVEQCIIDVNNEIIDYAQRVLGSATMGSTLVSLVIRGRVGVCLWAGDSRLYRLRNQKLMQLTRDHSHVQELVDIGAIDPEEAASHPQANVITRAVGVEEDGFIDINVFNTQIGDTFLLCSDGLYNTVDAEGIVEIMSQRNPTAAADELINRSLANGAPDNVSVIVVKGEPGRLGESS